LRVKLASEEQHGDIGRQRRAVMGALAGVGHKAAIFLDGFLRFQAIFQVIGMVRS